MAVATLSRTGSNHLWNAADWCDKASEQWKMRAEMIRQALGETKFRLPTGGTSRELQGRVEKLVTEIESIRDELRRVASTLPVRPVEATEEAA